MTRKPILPEDMTLPDEYGVEVLLKRRVPVDQVKLGRAYVIYARHGGVGVAVEKLDRLGYMLHRHKFGNHYLFCEFDWETPRYRDGTAVPVFAIEEAPPEDEERWIDWLDAQEHLHQQQIDEALDEVHPWRHRLGRVTNPFDRNPFDR